MKAKLTLNGKEYEVELTKEQVTKIEQNNTGFYDKSNELEVAYVSDRLKVLPEAHFADCDLCDNYARAISLFLQLSEWQAKNDEPPKDKKWYIRYYFGKFDTDYSITDFFHFMRVYFSSKEKAEQAIAFFHDELTWYFNEFKPRLDM